MRQVGLRFKDVWVVKGSDLAEALERDDKKAAEKVYAETTERYKKLYPEEDRKWFASFSPM